MHNNRFVENKGQIYDQNRRPNNDVKYLYRSEGYNIQLKSNSFSYDTYVAGPPNDSMMHYSFHRVDVELLNANPAPIVIATDSSQYYYNYYNSVTPVEGVNFVRGFSRVLYKDIYPGIDLVFTVSVDGSEGAKYNFIIHPGADIHEIKLKYVGATKTELENENIVIYFDEGIIRESIPASFLFENDQEVNVHYIKTGLNEYGFVSEYFDVNHTLVIDPSPQQDWGTYYGGSSNDRVYEIVCQDTSFIYGVGTTSYTDGIATAGAHQVTNGLNIPDGFIFKMNSSGILVWGTYYGGDGQDYGFDICLDQNGDVFAIGQTASTDAISTPGSHQPILGGDYDAFLVKFNALGVRQWGTYIGGLLDESGSGVIADISGNVYAVGRARSNSAISTPGSDQPLIGGAADGFINKFSSTGVRLWGTYMGGPNDDDCADVDVDTNLNIYVTGGTHSSSTISTLGAYQSNNNGSSDGFIASYNPLGIIQWCTYLGGPTFDMLTKIKADPGGNIYSAGSTESSSLIATPGAFQTAYGGMQDCYLTRLSSNGTMQWCTYFGGWAQETQWSLGIDQYGSAYIGGTTNTPTGITTPGVHQPSIAGAWDGFFAKFNSSGTRDWGTYFGGTSDENVMGIDVDDAGRIYIAGEAWSSTMVATSNTHDDTLSGPFDGFVARFSFCPVLDTIMSEVGAVCIGTSLNLSSISAGNYQWNGPGGFSSTQQNPVILNVNTSNEGMYSLTLTIGSCTKTDSIFVAILSAPDAVFDYTSFCGNLTQFQGEQTASGIISYLWDLNNDGIIDTIGDHFQYIFPSGPTHIVALTIVDSAGCLSDTSIMVSVIDSFPGGYSALIMPNILVYSSQVNNDRFDFNVFASGFNECYNYRLFIYDRWGLKVFETSNETIDPDLSCVKCFKGESFTGSMLVPGIYFYVLSIEDFQSTSGTITIFE